MYDRLGMQELPFPFYTLPAPGLRLDTLDFLPAMSTLLENLHGLAATYHAASLSDEVAQQEVSQGLFVLKEYTEATLVLFTRWHRDRYPGPTVHECRGGQGQPTPG